jgi:acyl carrier protein
VKHADVAERVATVFGQVFGSRVAFGPELARADDTYWTSLKHMELLIALETEFGVQFDGADAVDMQSVPTIIERVGERLG